MPLYLLNPMTLFVSAYRDVFLGDYRIRHHDQALFITDPMHWLKMTVFSVGMLIIGYLVFQRCSKRFAESL
jgi:ABC-type polysaccharide/polyol phosphate export permease